jgi:hypothetical protein
MNTPKINTVAMKLVFNSLLILFTSGVSLAQLNYVSTDQVNYPWSENSIWSRNTYTYGSTVPGTLNGTDRTFGGAVSSVQVYGQLSANENFIVGGTTRINISLDNKRTTGDTLTIYGNLTITESGIVDVNSFGVLVVSGDINIIGNGRLENSGVVISGGQIMLDNSGTLVNNIKSNGNGQNSKRNVYTVDGISLNNNGQITGNSNLLIGETYVLNDHAALSSAVINPQPIELLYFSGTSEHGKVHLDWTTAWEENFDFFTIERAGTDRVFKAIGEVKGKGNSTAEVAYSFTDNSPLEGQVFYRLKATDFDGTLEYHRIISVYTESLASASLQVYPNPLRDQQLSISTQGFTPEELKIMDLSGKVLFSERVTENTRQFSLPSQIRAGAYLLIITNPQGDKLQQKIMVL